MQRRRCRAGQEGSAPRAPALLFLAAGALLLMQLRGAAASEPDRCKKTTVAAGSLHTCAILDDATVKCWGRNANGQLGYGDTSSRAGSSNESFVDLGSGRTALSVSAGVDHTCAVLDDATVKCWGYNNKGQLGYNDTSTRGDEPNEMGARLAAVDLGAGRTAVFVSAADEHTCALLDDATVKCWGQNDEGQLGAGDSLNRGDGSGTNITAVALGAGRTALSVSTGKTHTCAVLDDATVKCWGYNHNGQLGYGDTSNRGDDSNEMGDRLPAVALGRTAVSVSVGIHTCALLDDGSVKCWGGNANGQLGYGDTSKRGAANFEMGDSLPAVDLGPGRTAVAVSVGGYHTCALLDDATVKCWGRNVWGQLGYGDTSKRGADRNEMGARLAAVNLGTGRTALSISAGNLLTCALLDDATVKCWGYNEEGQLGYFDPPGTYNRGVEAPFATDMASLAAVDLGPGRTVAPSGPAVCGDCPAGRYFTAVGAPSCTPCPAGSFVAAVWASVCVPCPKGSYSTAVGAANSTTCTFCPAGKYSTVKGSQKCTPCLAGSSWSAVVGSSTSPCLPCPAGTYAVVSQEDELGTCTACPEFSSSLASSDDASDCECNPGYASNATTDAPSCTPCPAGRYAASSGLAECTPCPAGSYSGAVAASASSTCTPCPAGSSWSSVIGFSTSAACSPCPSGTYAAGAGASGTCTACPTFSTSLASSVQPSDCVCNAGYALSENACLAIMTTPAPTPATTPASQPATVILAFTAEVQMSVAEFDTVRGGYIAGVAVALERAESEVRIVSVSATIRRRASSRTMVETAVTVPADQADLAASSLTAEKLNSALASRGITVASVSVARTSATTPSPSTTPGEVSGQAPMIVGIVVGILAAVVVLVCVFMWNRKHQRDRGKDEGTEMSWMVASNTEDVSSESDMTEGGIIPVAQLAITADFEIHVGQEPADGRPPGIAPIEPDDDPLRGPTEGGRNAAEEPEEPTRGETEGGSSGTMIRDHDPEPLSGTTIQNHPPEPVPPMVQESGTEDGANGATSNGNVSNASGGNGSNDSSNGNGSKAVSDGNGSNAAEASTQPWVGKKNAASFVERNSKFVARELVLGESAQAAEGLKEMLGLGNHTVLAILLKQSVEAIESEFLTHGSENDMENLSYCLDGIAQDPRWVPSQVKRDIDKGIYHGGIMQAGDYDEGHAGMTLDDFVEHDWSKLGKLGRAHVLALRLYTTSSFTLFNDPLRKRQKPHPFRMTVYYLDEGLRKLRAVRASMDAKGFAGKTVLWRGMKDMVLSDPQKFKEQGGTEVAPMSTTEDKQVALKYSSSERPLLFKFKAKGLSMGVDISYLSVYPKEREVLYPPLTYLMPSGNPELEGNVMVYTVKLTIS